MSVNTPPAKGLPPHIWAAIVWGCMLGGITVFFSPLVGIIIAHVQRRRLAETPFGGHISAAIRTFWISTILFFAGFFAVVAYLVAAKWPDPPNDTQAIAVIIIGVVAWALLGLWYLFRSGKGMILALNEVPWSTWLGIF